MSNLAFNSTPNQLLAIRSYLTQVKESTDTSDLYNLDYIKFFTHPETPSTIHIKVRTHGYSGGFPFDDIKWKVIDSEGHEAEITSIVPNLNAKYAFIAEMKEVALVDTHFEYVQ